MLRVCLDCLTRYAADLRKCPHCLSRKFQWSHEADAAAPVAQPAAAENAAAPAEPATAVADDA